MFTSSLYSLLYGHEHTIIVLRLSYRLSTQALTRLSEASEVYPESLTLTDVTSECGQQASGGFANVYKRTCLGEDIALKVLKYSLLSGVDSLDSWQRSSDDGCKNLLHEFMTWRQLLHPNVLPFYSIYFLLQTLFFFDMCCPCFLLFFFIYDLHAPSSRLTCLYTRTYFLFTLCFTCVCLEANTSPLPI